MLTVLECINKSADYLAAKGVECARTNAELLLGHLLKCNRLDLYLKFDQPLSENEIELYREFLKRRGMFEPLQYIIGSVEFYGLKIKVTPSVLIPRPETELLVETVINSVDKEDELNILDIGCGSGNISVALAANFPNSIVTGIDISEDAIKIAKENAGLHNLSSRINFSLKDILKDVSFDSKKFDIIVSNPPYVSEMDFEKVQPEIKNYEPDVAVTDHSDGFVFFRKISGISDKILRQQGMLFFEVAVNQSDHVKKILLNNGFENINIVNDYQNIERIIYGIKN